MDSKYFFRVYNKDANGNFFSPYTFDKINVDTGKRIQDNTDITKYPIGKDSVWLSDNTGVHEAKLEAPHYGFSVIGKITPDKSIWGGYLQDLYESVNNKEDTVLRNRIKNLLPDSTKHTNILKNSYADDETNDYEYFTNDIYNTEELFNSLHKAGIVNGVPVIGTFGKDDIDFDSDEAYDNLMYAVNMYTADPFDKQDDVSKSLFLVAAPEDKILSAQDAIKNNLSIQRDMPEELIATEITPIKEYADVHNAIRGYNHAKKKGASAKDAFFDAFKLDPAMIGSDRDIKYIYKDMSNAYNDIQSKRRLHNNIVNGLLAGGW